MQQNNPLKGPFGNKNAIELPGSKTTRQEIPIRKQSIIHNEKSTHDDEDREYTKDKRDWLADRTEGQFLDRHEYKQTSVGGICLQGRYPEEEEEETFK